jgi:adenine-specific DNA-methyltransferase
MFESSLVEFSTFDLPKMKELICEILDKNFLYVNLSDIDDQEYNITPADKKLNLSFYEK